MYPRYQATPPRISVGALVQISDGSVQTTGASVTVQPEGGSETAGGGTLACQGTSGIWTYVPTPTETNYTAFIVSVYKSGSIPTSVTVVTTASPTAGYAGVDWGKVTNPTTAVNLSSTTIATTQQVDIQTVKTRAVGDPGSGSTSYLARVPSPGFPLAVSGCTGGSATANGNYNFSSVYNGANCWTNGTWYLWWDSLGLNWVLSAVTGTPGAGFFIYNVGYGLFDPYGLTLSASGTATGTASISAPVTWVGGGSVLLNVNATQWGGTNVGTANVRSNVTQINGVATSSVTTVNAVIGESYTIQQDAGGYVKVSTGTGTGQINLAGGVASANLTATGWNGASLPASFTASNTAAIATAVWTDTTASDFTTASSIGKSVMNGVALGTGLTVANLTNAPTAGDLTASMKTSVTTAATAATPTIAGYTGNTPQTGDAYLELTKAQTEPGSIPAYNASLETKLNWLFALAVNKITQTATTQTIFGHGGSSISTSTESDDGTIFTRGAFS